MSVCVCETVVATETECLDLFNKILQTGSLKIALTVSNIVAILNT